MKKSRFTESPIMAILKQHEAGVSIPELAREHNVSTAAIYQWRSCSSMRALAQVHSEHQSGFQSPLSRTE